MYYYKDYKTEIWDQFRENMMKFKSETKSESTKTEKSDDKSDVKSQVWTSNTIS